MRIENLFSLSRLAKLAAAAAVCLGVVASARAQVANDDFANAEEITGVWGSVTVDTTEATAEPSEPSHAGQMPTSTIWYRFTAPLDGEVVVDTFGSDFTTVLAVYTGSGLTTLGQVAANDGANFGANSAYNYAFSFNDDSWGPSSARFLATAGKTYYIAVGGNSGAFGGMYSGTTGSAVLNWAYHSSGVFRFAASKYDPQTGLPLYTCSEYESFTGVPDDVSMVEYDQQGLVITVTRTCGAAGRVLVDYTATDGTAFNFMDYFLADGTLVFNDNEMSKTIFVPVLPSQPAVLQPAEGEEATALMRDFTITLSNPRLDQESTNDISAPRIDPMLGTALVNILDGDVDPVLQRNITQADTNSPPIVTGPSNSVFNFEKSAFFIAEDVTNRWGKVIINVTRSGTNREAADIQYLVNGVPFYTDNERNNTFPLQAGSDYASPDPANGGAHLGTDPDFSPISGTLHWGADDFDPKEISFDVYTDALTEFNEDFYLSIWRVVDNREVRVGMINNATVTILFNDLNPPAGSVDEFHNMDYDLTTVPPQMSHPGADGVVYDLYTEADNKTIIVGDFGSYNTVPRSRIARMNVDGSLDISFNPGEGANGFVSTIIPASGKYMIGGLFNFYNGTQRPGIARINADGSLDNAFAPGLGADGTVWAIAMQTDGQILIGGEFNSYANVPRAHVARLNPDGSLDTTFDPSLAGLNGVVNALAVTANGQVLVGGDFVSSITNAVLNLVRLNADGSLDTNFFSTLGLGVDGPIYSIALQTDGKILLGGEFSSVNVARRIRLARLNTDGTLDPTFDPATGPDATVYSVNPRPDGTIYVGGLFTSYNGTRRAGFARMYTDATLDTTFLDTAYNQFAGLVRTNYSAPTPFVWASAVQSDGQVMIGGGFEQVGGGIRIPDIQVPDSSYVFGFEQPLNRGAYRNRANVARLVGGATPGPGNVGLLYDSYTANQQQTYLKVSLLRSNGLLGYASANLSIQSGSAQSGVSYLYNNISPVYRGIWSLSRMVGEGIYGTNTWMYDRFGNQWRDDAVSIPVISILNPQISGNRYSSFRLSNPTIADSFYLGGENIPLGVALGRSSAAFSIIDDSHTPGTLSFSSATYAGTEGSNILVTVNRTLGTYGSVSVLFSTGNGSAIGGIDYYATNGSLTFQAGQTSKSFVVKTINNSRIQPADRTINLRIYSPGGSATLGLANAVASIVDDDYPPGFVNFTAATYTTNETSGAVTVTAVRSGGAKGTITVQCGTTNGTALNGVHYNGLTNTLVWNDGDVTPQQFTVPLVADQKVGPNTYFTAFLFNATVNTTNAPNVLGGSVTRATVNIVDDDSYGTLQFSAPTYSVNENGGFATITVIRTGGAAEALSVQYATADATAVSTGILPNYTATAGALAFAPGEVAKSFNIPIIPDGQADPDPFFFTVSLTGSTPSGVIATQNVCAVYIVDSEAYNQPAGSLDVGFDPSPGFNGDVYDLALQPDGAILVVGDFTKVNSAYRNRIVRLNANATLDDSFLSGLNGANGAVRTVLLQSDARVLIGGSFTTVNGVYRNRLARLLEDGNLDTSFNPGTGTDSSVFAAAEVFVGPERRLLIGGEFQDVNGSQRSGLTRLNNDGSLDNTFDTGLSLDGTVYTIAVYPTNSIQAGKIVIGGNFTAVNGVPRKGVARLNPNGTLDVTFNPGTGASDAVRALAIQSDGRLIVGGSFTNFAGAVIRQSHLTRLNLNGSIDTTFNSGVGANDTVDDIAIQADNRILLVGEFTRASGVSRGRITRLLPDGSVDPWINFGLGADSFISSVLVQPDGMILLGGGFSQYDGEARHGLARIYGGSISGSGSFQFTGAEFVADENSTNATITVRRRGGTFGNMTVTFSTTPGTAVPGVNYSNVTATMQFPFGETFSSVRVPLIDDLQITPDLTVNLALSNPLPPSGLGDQPIATLRIANDDSAISFKSSSGSRNEDAIDGAATIVINRQGSTRQPASVEFLTTTNGTAIAGTNYVAVTNALVFDPGVTEKSVKVPVLHDPSARGDVTVVLALTNVSNALLINPSQFTLTIVDVDRKPGQLMFVRTNYVVSEGAGYLGVTVLRTNGRSGVVTVNYATAAGTATPGLKYGSTNGTLTFNDNEVQKTFYVGIVQEPQVEGDQTFSLSLSNAVGGATIIGPAVVPVTIVDDDLGVGFSSPAYVVSEKDASVTLAVVRQNGSNTVTSVSYATTNVTATAGTNYVTSSGTLVFTNGETLKTFSIPILHDPRVTGDLSFGVNLFNPTAPAQLITPSSAAVVVLDADPGICFSNEVFGVLKSSNSVTISVVRSNANTGTVAVNYATTNGTAIADVDYRAASGQLVFSNGITSRTFDVQIIPNRLAQGDRTFTIGLFNPTNGAQIIAPAVASVVITDDISGLSFSAPAYSVNENGVRAQITVFRSNYTNSTVSVDYYTSDGTGKAGVNYLATSGTLVFTNGETSKSFYVTNIDNTLVDGDQTVILGLRNPVGNAEILTPSVTLTIIETDGSLVMPAGSALISESGPANGSIDPGETVTMLLALRNATGTNTANLVATLLATNGVSNPTGPQNYGVLAVHGASKYRPFSFTASGTNGQPIAVTLALTDGSTSLSNAVFNLNIGNPATIFANSTPIIINDRTNATPYPSVINVSGLGGVVTKATVTLTNMTHGWPADVDVLLVAPTGEKSFLMAKAGGSYSITNLTLIFDQNAPSALPQAGPLVSGTYQPASYAGATPPFQAPAPPAPYPTNLSSFVGATPNGNWSLYVLDDSAAHSGIISNGWILSLNTGLPSSADVGLAMTSAPLGNVILGNTVAYSIILSNYGPSSASNIVVSDTLPGATAYVSSTALVGTVATNGAGLVTWTVPSLPVNTSAVLTINAQPGQIGQAINAAAVASGTIDLNPDDNTATVTNTIVTPTADLAAAMTGEPNQLNFGGNVTYTITITNGGPATAPAVTLSDALPAGLRFVSASPLAYSVSGQTILFTNLGSLPSGGQMVATVVASTVKSGDITNTVNCASGVTDPSKGNNFASVKVSVVPPPTPPPARLALHFVPPAVAGGELTLVWPVEPIGWVPEQATTVNPPGGWTTTINGSLGVPVVNGTNYNLRVQINSSNQFFRLRWIRP